jgi:hypothetical protein
MSIFTEWRDAQSKRTPWYSRKTQFYSIVFVHFGAFKAIESMKFSPATEFCREKLL